MSTERGVFLYCDNCNKRFNSDKFVVYCDESGFTCNGKRFDSIKCMMDHKHLYHRERQ